MSVELDWLRAFQAVELEIVRFELRQDSVQAVVMYRTRQIQIDVDQGGALPTVYCCCGTGTPMRHLFSVSPRRGDRAVWCRMLRMRLDATVFPCAR